MKVGPHILGVCSWSLKPATMRDLVDKVRACGLSHVQLALQPLMKMEPDQRQKELQVLRESGIALTAGMIGFPGEDYSTLKTIHATGGLRPDDRWNENFAIVQQAGPLAKSLGLNIVTFHCGFIPQPGDALYGTMVQRVARVADAFATHGVAAMMETGQESAPTLAQFLKDIARPNLGANFDPANMLLYASGDPIEAIGILGNHIRHVHVKDATVSNQPGVIWGKEVPFGTGEVGPRRFLDALQHIGYTGPLVIEREAGASRVEDVKLAIANLNS